MKRVWRQLSDGSLVEITAGDPRPVRGNDSVLWNDRLYQDAGDPRFSSRSQHREFMRSRGLTTVDDYIETWKKAERQRAEFYTNAPDKSRAEDVVRAFQNPKTGISRKDVIPKE